MSRDEHQDLVVGPLRVLHDHVEIPVLVEDAGIEELVLHLQLAAMPVGDDQILVGVRALWILVEALHIRVRRRAVEVEPVLLDVLAVVALTVGEAEHALLEDRIGPVPERQRQTQPLLVVADAGDPVLTPSVRPRARLVMCEVIPRVAVGAVVLADCPPLALAQIGAPGLPGDRTRAGLLKSNVLRSSVYRRRWAHGSVVWPPRARRANVLAPSAPGVRARLHESERIRWRARRRCARMSRRAQITPASTPERAHLREPP